MRRASSGTGGARDRPGRRAFTVRTTPFRSATSTRSCRACMENRARVFYTMGVYADFDQRVVGWVNGLRTQARNGRHPPLRVRGARSRAARHAPLQVGPRARAAAHRGAHQRAGAPARDALLPPGATEYQVMAELLHEFRRHNADTAYHADRRRRRQQLHPALPRQRPAARQTATCCWSTRGASSSATPRTSPARLPVNGRFTPQQRAVYEVVLEANRAAIACVRPGNHWNDPHEAAVRVDHPGSGEARVAQGPGTLAHQERRVPALLHAPHRALARARRARRRRLQGGRRMARPRAGHGDDHRARHLPAGGRARCTPAFSQHRHPHRGRRGGDAGAAPKCSRRARRRTPTRSKRSWRAACR